MATRNADRAELHNDRAAAKVLCSPLPPFPRPPPYACALSVHTRGDGALDTPKLRPQPSSSLHLAPLTLLHTSLHPQPQAPNPQARRRRAHRPHPPAADRGGEDVRAEIARRWFKMHVVSEVRIGCKVHHAHTHAFANSAFTAAKPARCLPTFRARTHCHTAVPPPIETVGIAPPPR